MTTHTPAPLIVHLDGRLMPIEEARVPVLDRGFLLGDGVYEVVPVYAGRPFRWAQHLARLHRSLSLARIDNPNSDAQWRELIDQLVACHPWSDQFIYLQVTRGVARRDHAFPVDTKPTVFAMSSPLVLPNETQRELGVSAITLRDERWLHCDIKSISLLGNVLARQNAVEAGAAEAILVRDGFITEGAASNIWIVRNGTLIGPPRNHLILEGVRMQLMAELCQREGIAFDERRIAHAELALADEVLLTSATREILPITRIDGRPVASGTPGALYRRLLAAYQRAKANE